MDAAPQGLARVEAELVRADPYWPAQVAVLGAMLLHVALPGKLTVGPDWIVPTCEGALLLALVVSTPRGGLSAASAGHAAPHRRRGLTIALIALVSAANLVALDLLVHFLLKGGRTGGRELILAGVEIWWTNLLIFAVWFWELDRGGPDRRAEPDAPLPDFLFPQMTSPETARPGWRPNFLDYLYTSFTNATAFSPTDTMPLSAWAKALMLVESLAALVTVGLVAARAVNILS